MVLAICDPIAGILGINLEQYNNKIRIFNYQLQKTWLGSLSFFVSCLTISAIALYFNRMKLNLEIFGIALVISLVSTIAELISWKGIDNLPNPNERVIGYTADSIVQQNYYF